MPGNGQYHALGSALEQRDLQFAFQALDALGQGRLGGAHRFRGAADMAGVGYGKKIIQVFQSHFIPARYRNAAGHHHTLALAMSTWVIPTIHASFE
jgi:hypothetical protein